MKNKIKKIIHENKKFNIVTHERPDGDACGSSLGLFYLLKKLKKDISIIDFDDYNKRYDFLTEEKISNKIKNTNITFVLDCGEYSRIKKDYREKLKNSFLINIDHHSGNTNFGDLNIVNTDVSSTAEIIFDIYSENYATQEMDIKFYESIYTGIATDTGNFSFSNANEKTFKVVSRIMKYLKNPSEIYKKIYCNKPIKKIRITGDVLKRIKLYFNNKVAISYVKKSDMKKYNLKKSDLEEIVNFLGEIKNVEVYILIKERNEKEYRLSLRSNGKYSVRKMAEYFKNGGGHQFAAGTTLLGGFDSVYEKILNYWREKI